MPVSKDRQCSEQPKLRGFLKTIMARIYIVRTRRAIEILLETSKEKMPAITLLIMINIALSTVVMIPIVIYFIAIVKMLLTIIITVLTKIIDNCNSHDRNHHKDNDKDDSNNIIITTTR